MIDQVRIRHEKDHTEITLWIAGITFTKFVTEGRDINIVKKLAEKEGVCVLETGARMVF